MYGVLVALAGSFALGGRNTTEGFGKDLKTVRGKSEKKADE